LLKLKVQHVEKTSSSVFILVANLIILAHAVVPHHHHQMQVCLGALHCLHDHHSTNQASSAHHNDHDGGKEACFLKQLVVIPSNQAKLECKFVVVSMTGYPSTGLMPFYVVTVFCPLLRQGQPLLKSRHQRGHLLLWFMSTQVCGLHLLFKF
jgi:hypothetical protein